MTIALITSPCEILRRTLADQVRTLTGWDTLMLDRPAESRGYLTAGGKLVLFLDCRSRDLEQETCDLLEDLDRMDEIPRPRIIGITELGYPRRLWGLVDRLVSGHLRLPAEPGVISQLLSAEIDGYGSENQARMVPRELAADGLKFETRTQTLFSILEQLERVARHDVTLLFTGETGTGKSYLAQLVHEISDRCHGPFFATACGALPPDLIESELFGHVRGAFTSAVRSSDGRFEAAKGGTLLLDEIDVLGPKEQSKLLHVIETGKYEPVGSTDTRVADVRLIVASNVDLRELAERHQFRMDLYYRLNVLEFHLPPLRERPHDVIPLAASFIDQSCSKHRVHVTHMDAHFLELLKQYHWPGNIRELLNQMRRAVLFSKDGVLTPDSLALSLNASRPRANGNGASFQKPAEWNLNRRMAYSEREFLQETLRAHSNNRAATARALGISRSALYKKLNRMGLLSFDINAADDVPRMPAIRVVPEGTGIQDDPGNGSRVESRHQAAS